LRIQPDTHAAGCLNATEVGAAFFTTPGVPADRLTALRRAFDATMKDPELLADAQRINVGISPSAGGRA
jgi:tripartite-type tricarboxylate transporter receptor subunit TctC